MDTREAKKALRMRIKDVNKTLTGGYKSWASQRICRKVIASMDYQRADCIFCFVGVGDEPDTRYIIEDALKKGKRVLVPRCIDKENMVAVEITDFEKDLERGFYDLLEPKEDLPVVSREAIRFAVIPCVTCDEEGNRLGHGRGYYDRYLQDTVFPQAMLCFQKVMVPVGEIPVGEYDLPIDTVVTDA